MLLVRCSVSVQKRAKLTKERVRAQRGCAAWGCGTTRRCACSHCPRSCRSLVPTSARSCLHPLSPTIICFFANSIAARHHSQGLLPRSLLLAQLSPQAAFVLVGLGDGYVSNAVFSAARHKMPTISALVSCRLAIAADKSLSLESQKKTLLGTTGNLFRSTIDFR